MGAELLETVRGVLAAILIWSAAGKLCDFEANARALSRHVRTRSPVLVLCLLCAVEGFLAGGLIATGFSSDRFLRSIALGACALLFLTFAGVLSFSHWRGIDAPCACFGNASESLSSGTVARAYSLAALAGSVAVIELWHRSPLDSLDSPGTALSLGVLMVGLVALILVFRQIEPLLGSSRAVRVGASPNFTFLSPRTRRVSSYDRGAQA